MVVVKAVASLVVAKALVPLIVIDQTKSMSTSFTYRSSSSLCLEESSHHRCRALIGLFTSPPNYSPLRFEKRLAKLNLGHDCRRSTEDGSSLASLEFAVGGQIKAKPGNHRIHGRGHQDVVASGQCSKITTGTPIN